jgi:23S rRNA (cytosine1962-C5)-methyltransferase
MNLSINLNINPKYLKKYQTGYPLMLKETLTGYKNEMAEGTIINLCDYQKKFICKGYLGKQNKGIGWVLSYDEQEDINQAFFNRKIEQALNHRKTFFSDTETTAFRVFNGEGDGIGGITIDYYGGYYLINWYSIGIYTFKDLIIKALETFTNYKGIYEKKRFDTKGKYMADDDFVCGERAEFPIIIKENGVKFAIYLNEGPMTGVFLDQREVRKTIRDKYSKGNHVLNTFSYTGAFSVFAAMGGASKTTSVDLANRSLPKTKEQFEINLIDVKRQDIVVEDVFNYFKYAVKKGLTYDMVVVDPPSFARSKKHTFSAAKDYVDLLKEIIQITKDKGVIVASTNCSNFDMKKFKQFIRKAFSEMNESYEILETFSLPEDFRVLKAYEEGNYLKVVFIRRS